MISAHARSRPASGRVGLRIDSRGALALIIPRGGAPQLPTLLLTRKHLHTRKPNSQHTVYIHARGPFPNRLKSHFRLEGKWEQKWLEGTHLQVPLKLRIIDLPIPLKPHSRKHSDFRPADSTDEAKTSTKASLKRTITAALNERCPSRSLCSTKSRLAQTAQQLPIVNVAPQRIASAYIAVGHEYPSPLRPHPLQLLSRESPTAVRVVCRHKRLTRHAKDFR